MFPRIPTTTYLLSGILCVTLAVLLVYGCREQQNQPNVTAPAARPAVVLLNMAKGAAAQAKAINLMITATDDNGQTVSQIFNQPVFPVNTDLEVTVPPCHYTITATATLSGGEVTSASAEVDACTFDGETVTLSIAVYEPFFLTGMLIRASSPVDAGVTMTVTCTGNVTAPDIDNYPIQVELRETAGSVVSGVFHWSGEVLSGAFPDPYPVIYGSSPTRIFTCTLSDDRGTTQNETQIVARITPTPTPTPTATPKPTTYTLTVAIQSPSVSNTVITNVGGIDCLPLCSASYAPGTVIQLSASVSMFSHWTGDCAGMLPTCTITMDAPKSVTAVFY